MPKTLSKLVQNPMTEALSYELADRLFKAAQNIMVYLCGRWVDEHEYEDINEYKLPLKDLLSKANATNVKMNSRPFGFTCKIGEQTYQYSVTSRSYSFKRIK
jgi:hypothetical protein